METRSDRLIILGAIVLVAASCHKAPHLVLTIEDPDGVAAGADTIAAGSSLSALQPIRLPVAEFPLTITVTAPSAGEREVWVEAWTNGSPEQVRGRGRTAAVFAATGMPTATAALRRPCAVESDCAVSVFCAPQSTCVQSMCEAGAAPCAASPHACLKVTCVEAARACDVRVDHSSCAPLDIGGGVMDATYCDPAAGCVRGSPCLTDGDCEDGSTCNGVERCIGYRCAAGVPPAVDDGNPCNADACVEPQGPAHFADESRNGAACEPEAGGDGICLHGECVVTTCGDGYVDARSEQCDDGNTNLNDGCAQCRRTSWRAEVLSGLGYTGGIAAAASIGPYGVAVDAWGNVFAPDAHSHRVWRFDRATGLLTLVAGTGSPGFSGDGGSAASAQLCSPNSVAVDGMGNVFIADANNHRIRKVCGDGVGCRRGHISTVAGTGEFGFGGDNGPASAAQLNSPLGVAVDGTGNLLVADSRNHRVRRVCGDGVGCTIGNISTVAGTGTPGSSGDNGPAASAQLNYPSGVAVDRAGNIFISDFNNARVRRVCSDAAGCTKGYIYTFAGTGTSGFSGDDGPATNAQIDSPNGVAVDRSGNVFIAGSNRLRKVCGDAIGCTKGYIYTFAGIGTWGFSGDDGPATGAQFYIIGGVAVDGTGNVFVADVGNHRLRRVCGDGVGCTKGNVTTLSGSGIDIFSGDGGPATSAPLAFVSGVAVDGAGNVFIADPNQGRVRRVCMDGSACTKGEISTLAGTGVSGFAGDNGPAVSAQLQDSRAVAVDGTGNVFIVNSDRLRKVCGDGVGCAKGYIYTFAGGNGLSFGGDNGPAMSAQFCIIGGVAVDGTGNVFIADSGNGRIRKVCGDGVDCTKGYVYTLAGTGAAGFSGDDVPAASAQLNFPAGVATDSKGNVFIADTTNHRIRKVCIDGAGCTKGNIYTVAGNGTPGFSSDGVPATSAQLYSPQGVAVDGAGNVFIADTENHRIRKVCMDGEDCTKGDISTVAGTGAPGVFGDGGPASSAQLYRPEGVAVDAAGNVFVADTRNSRIRKVCRDGVGCTIDFIYTFAGAVDPAGDGLIGKSALGSPYQTVELAGAGLSTWLVADGVSGRVRAVDAVGATVGTVVGYPWGFVTENAAARYSRVLFDARGIAVDAAGAQVFVSEYAGHTLRRVNLATTPWSISTWAGSLSVPGHVDGSLTESRFAGPSGLLFDAASRTLTIADAGNHVLRAIDVEQGTVTTIAGTPRTRGYYGEGVPASDALLNGPQALARGNDGSLYLADTLNHRVRRIDASGIIDTVLGDGTGVSSGEGAPARLFPVDSPLGLAVDGWGDLFVSSMTALRVVIAGADNVAKGDDEVVTIYGRPPRQSFPESVTFCLSGIGVLDGAQGARDGRLYVLDACAGYVIQLERQAL